MLDELHSAWMRGRRRGRWEMQRMEHRAVCLIGVVGDLVSQVQLRTRVKELPFFNKLSETRKLIASLASGPEMACQWSCRNLIAMVSTTDSHT